MADVRGTPGEVTLTVLGAHLVPRAGRAVRAAGLVGLLVELGYTAGAVRVALSRLVQRGLLVSTRNGRAVSYTLTPRAQQVLAEGDRRIFVLGKEDRDGTAWTVLCHTMPEDRRESRERLVRRLRFLGFGPVQDGTWIAPHDRQADVRALLHELGIDDHVGLLLGEPPSAQDVRAFVARAWDLDALGARYGEFVAEFGAYNTAAARKRLDDAQAFAVRTRMTHVFRQFPSLDPDLPPKLVAPPAHRAQAVRLFDKLYAALSDAAQRHFDEVTSP